MPRPADDDAFRLRREHGSTARFLFALAAVMLTVSASATDAVRGAPDNPQTAIVGADVVNPVGHRSLPDATVVLSGGRIVTVGRRDEVAVPEGARVVDGRGKWLIPGLMDLHVHVSQSAHLLGAYEGGAHGQPWPVESTGSFAPGANLFSPRLGIRNTLRAFARSGITTVRSLGEEDWAYAGPDSVRASAARDPAAPRVIMSTPTFHPRTDDPSGHRVTTPRDGVEKLRAFRETHGVAFLKIWWVDGRFVGEADAPEDWLKHKPIVEAMLAEAKRLGMRNGVDAIEAWKAKEVVRMGGDLVHGIFFGEVDDELIRLMKERGTRTNWTLVASARYFGALTGRVPFTTAEILLGDPHAMAQVIDIKSTDTDKLVIPPGGSRFDGMTLSQAMKAPPYDEEITVATRNLRRVHEAGIAVGLGTDAGVPGIPFGASIFAEMRYYRQAGLSPREVLSAATINNAAILGLQDELGSIDAGKRADLVLLGADPMADIMNAAKVEGLVRDGRYLSLDKLDDDSPADVVTRLRNGFNSGDREAMAALLHEDVRFRTLDEDWPELPGRAAVLAEFARGSDGAAHRRLVSAAADGATVVQKEHWPDGRNHVVRYVLQSSKIVDITIVSVE